MKRRWLRRRLGNKGTAAIELALLAPMLGALMTGVWDFGNAMLQQERITSAARAGAQFGLSTTANSTNYTGMVQAARSDAADSANSLTIVAQTTCTCPNGGAVSCSGTCVGGASLWTYDQVAISEPYTTFITYPFMSNPVTLSATEMIRVQ